MRAKVYRIKDDEEVTEEIERCKDLGLRNYGDRIAELEEQLREEVDITFDETDVAWMIVFVSDKIKKKIISIGLKSGFEADLVYSKKVEDRINEILS
jgi:hypothetical protein